MISGWQASVALDRRDYDITADQGAIGNKVPIMLAIEYSKAMAFASQRRRRSAQVANTAASTPSAKTASPALAVNCGQPFPDSRDLHLLRLRGFADLSGETIILIERC